MFITPEKIELFTTLCSCIFCRKNAWALSNCCLMALLASPLFCWTESLSLFYVLLQAVWCIFLRIVHSSAPNSITFTRSLSVRKLNSASSPSGPCSLCLVKMLFRRSPTKPQLSYFLKLSLRMIFWQFSTLERPCMKVLNKIT